MTPYEKMLKAMKMQQNPETKIQIGIVKDGGRIALAEITLEPSDYMKNKLMDIFQYTDTDGNTITIDNRMKTGETVAVYRTSEEKWIVIGRFA